jgi:sigma-B regulation protein RsbU (phosphoserine phosphatase)
MASEPLPAAAAPPPEGPLAQDATPSELQQRDAEIAELRESLARLERRMQDELRLAASVQRSLLPPQRDFAGLELAREFIPFREVGGDYFDVVELPRRRVALAIGDVMGKGVPAALLVATLTTALRTQLRAGVDEAVELIGRVNRLFFEVTPRGRFATFFLGLLDLESGRLDYVNAGHDYPFLVGAAGASRALATGGTVLGLVEDTRYEGASVQLERGDLLVLYTDGVTDRQSAEGEPYGAERLQQAAARSRNDSARIALYSLLGEVQGWSSGCPAEDDTTLLVAKRV